jgi:hypothetical protein
MPDAVPLALAPPDICANAVVPTSAAADTAAIIIIRIILS